MAPALTREIQRQGVDITVEECEGIIETVASDFPMAWKFLEDGARFAVEHEYLATPFGRRRRFSGAGLLSRKDQASIGREAKNVRMQSTVADLLARAGQLFHYFRYQTDIGRELNYKILLPIHDAFLFEVPEAQVERFKPLIDVCMSKMNPIPGTEHRLGVDIEVMHRWGEH